MPIIKTIICLLLLAISSINSADAQILKKRKKQQSPVKSHAPKTQKEKKFIKDFFADEVKVDSGLFNLYLHGEKLYFEIPQQKLEKEQLLISRIAKAPAKLSPFLNAGSKVGEQTVVWEKLGEKILLRTKSYSNVADEEDPILISVENNNFQPIISSFNIEAYNDDSTSYLINVSAFFTKDIKALSGISSRMRKNLKVKNLDRARSLLESAKSFPINVELKHIATYNASMPTTQYKTESVSLLMNQSFIELPEELMDKRSYDHRVGWFSFGQIDYSSDALKSDQKKYLRRWKLIPKDKDAYARGELVEPIKPIVYYIDPSTPEIWRPYFKQGIEDWNECFATAGFKNAIIAKEPPSKEEDPDFSPEDARYSVVRYVASTTRNAVGPSVSDPRSGEILESDIIWYHNHLRTYRNRYMLETGAANPKARMLNTPQEEIGEMMRRVISHEIGHALGLPHNMKASSAYPVDSLRNGDYTQKWGIATTIMDYARFNYVAQPGDENIRFVRQIGPYDHFAINFGYRYFPEKSEKSSLRELVDKKYGDKKYMFGSGYPRVDPTSLTENIGDDNIKASTYGISNLKIVADSLLNWTAVGETNYDDFRELHGEMLSVWNRYVGHVIPMIGGIYETRKNVYESGAVYEHVSSQDQRLAMQFLVREAFSDQLWLSPKVYADFLSGDSGLERVSKYQIRQLKTLLNEPRLQRMIENEFHNNSNAYSLLQMSNDLTDAIFGKQEKPSANLRILQRAYVDRISFLLKNAEPSSKEVNYSDIQAIMRMQLDNITQICKRNSVGSTIYSAHFNDVNARIEKIGEHR